MNRKWQVSKYLFLDFFAAALAWAIFYVYRKEIIEPQYFGGWDVPFELTPQFYLGLLIIPSGWISFYYISGFYKNIYRRSRLLELGQTFTTSLIGVTVLFFAFILDDWIESYKNYYQLFGTLFALQFTFTYFFRIILTTQTIHKIHRRKIGFNTLLVGNNEKALRVYQEMNSHIRPAGNKFIGFVNVSPKSPELLNKHLPFLGTLDNITNILEQHKIEEVILALETSEHKKLSEIVTSIENRQVTIWGIPSLYDLLSSVSKNNTIFGTPLIKISNGLMPAWQENTKRLLDVLLSLLAVVLFSPIFLILAIAIIINSKGPVFYKQERIGRFGKPFHLYKLRSMVIDAERDEPILSTTNDNRITKVGKFLRKTHLDEIPQFFNVIQGTMSLVGPRPERAFFEKQIIKRAPHYTQLHKLRPGITSWGQVKYGYASTVDEMIERLPYDILYLKNISLYLDFKILIYTIMVSVRGSGK